MSDFRLALDSFFHLLIDVKYLLFRKLFVIFVKILNHHGFNALFIRPRSFIRTSAVIDVSSYRFISEKFQGLYPLIPVRFKAGKPSFFNQPIRGVLLADKISIDVLQNCFEPNFEAHFIHLKNKNNVQ